MGYLLTTRAALRREYYLLTGSSSDDDSREEHDAEADEQVHRALQFGLWNAQRHLIDLGAGNDWLTTSSALSWAEHASGAQYATAPTDLLRFAGDEDYPALREEDGTQWGRLLRDLRQRWLVRGDWFWWAEKKVWAAIEANLPTTLYLDYYAKASLPTDDTTEITNFPEEAIGMVPAEAAFYAMHQSWLPGGQDMESKIARSREYWRVQAAQNLRRDGGIRFNDRETIGSHWMTW